MFTVYLNAKSSNRCNLPCYSHCDLNNNRVVQLLKSSGKFGLSYASWISKALLCEQITENERTLSSNLWVNILWLITR